jgi:hypothetical protein
MRRLLGTVGLLLLALGTAAAPALADGGPIVQQREIWQALEEGQQIAVVTLASDGVVKTDLFISLIDHTGTSHEITFFLPLGHGASGLSAAEEDSARFEQALTVPLDERLEQAVLEERDLGRNLHWSLLTGSWVINGTYAWPLVALLALSSCASDAPQPIDVLYTASSRVAIYGLDENTDLAALVATTGLDPAVQETLRALTGQQIAVVSMRTQPPAAGAPGSPPGGEVSSQQGLHLGWKSIVIEQADGSWEHHYPLGTGGAWARPIPLTRVYVAAPAGLGFRVEYPTYGSDLSRDYVRSWYSRNAQWSVYERREETAYAVDQRFTPGGLVWRGVYTQANPTSDLRIVHDAAAVRAVASLARLHRMRLLVSRWSWVPSVLIALAAWVVCWRYIMPSHLGRRYRWTDRTFWREVLAYPLVNGLLLVVLVGTLTVLSRLETDLTLLLGIPILAGAVLLPLPVSSILFGQKQTGHKGRAMRGYWIVALLANAIHLTVGAAGVTLLGNLLR